MRLSDIVKGKRVAIFLRKDPVLARVIKEEGALGVAYYRAKKSADLPYAISRLYITESDIAKNNAEVLFLCGAAARTLRHRNFHYIGHARFILLPVGFNAASLFLALQRHTARERLKFKGFISAGSSFRKSFWLVFENINKNFTRDALYYFSPRHSASFFFSALQNLNYCVIDDNYPGSKSTSGHSMKLLVHNDDVDELTQRVTLDLGFSPIEIYAPFSVPGHALKSHISYFPPERSLEMLARSADGIDGRCPEPHDQLLGYCYHLLFHETDLTLGPQGELLSNTWGDHSIRAKLDMLCDKVGIPKFSSINEMEDLLRQENWFPSTETLAFIARDNLFVRRRYVNFLKLKPGLVVFIIRQLAADHSLIDTMVEMIAAEGFSILKSAEIRPDLREIVKARFRGGNWALPRDAGAPVHFVIAHDKNPIPVNAKLFVDAIATDNGRLLAKQKIRKKAALIAGVPSFNVLHSSDNSAAALEYIEILSPDLYKTCTSIVENPN